MLKPVRNVLVVGSKYISGIGFFLKEAEAGFYLKRDKSPGRTLVLDNLDVGVNSIVVGCLFAKEPTILGKEVIES